MRHSVMTALIVLRILRKFLVRAKLGAWLFNRILETPPLVISLVNDTLHLTPQKFILFNYASKLVNKY